MMPAGTFGSRCKGMFTIPDIQVRVQLQFALEGTRELSTGLSHHDKEFFIFTSFTMQTPLPKATYNTGQIYIYIYIIRCILPGYRTHVQATAQELINVRNLE